MGESACQESYHQATFLVERPAKSGLPWTPLIINGIVPLCLHLPRNSIRKYIPEDIECWILRAYVRKRENPLWGDGVVGRCRRL
jgi:hypothetical protein